MGRTGSFVVGAIAGMAVAAAATYLWGPARETTYDQHYQSRWDQAVAEGKQAARDHEAALRRQLAAAKHMPPAATA